VLLTPPVTIIPLPFPTPFVAGMDFALESFASYGGYSPPRSDLDPSLPREK